MPKLFTFDKSVNIANPKLKLSFWLLWALFFSGGLTNFILSRKHKIKQDISDRIFTETWIDNPGFESLRESVADAMRTSDFCTAPGKYDYWWDSSGVWTYENYTCRPMCPENQNDSECVSPLEVGKDHMSGTIELYTSVQDTVTNSLTSSYHELQSRNYWVMSADHLGIGFSYAYEMTASALLTEGSLFGNVFSEGSSLRSSSQHYAPNPLVTVILDIEGNLWRKVLPSESIRITVTELLQLVGNENLLDEPNVYGVPNQLRRSGALQGKPTPRLTGVWIDLELGCYTGSNPNLLGVDIGDLAMADLCTIKPRRIPVGWVSESHRLDAFGNGTLLHRRYSGFKITITPSGEVEYFDFNHMFLNIVALIVLLGYPAKIVSFLAQTCFGHLSTIYKKALVEDFDIMTQVAGAAAKLSTGTLAYESMTKANEVVNMTSRTLQGPLKTLLREANELQEEEVEAMARFCVFEMSNLPTKVRRSSRLESLTYKMGLQNLASEIRELTGSRNKFFTHGINPDKFSAALCLESAVDLRDLAKLFDKDRKVSVLERFFTPSMLWNAVHRAHGFLDDEPAETGCTPNTPSTKVGFQSEECPEATHQLNQIRAECEERFAKSESEMKAWMGVISGTLSSMETRMRSLERGRVQPAQTSGSAGTAHVSVSEGGPPVEKGSRSRPLESGDLVELRERMATLEQCLEVMASDVANWKSTQVSAKNQAPSVMGQVELPEDVIAPPLERRVATLEDTLAAIDVDVWKLGAALGPPRDDVAEHTASTTWRQEYIETRRGYMESTWRSGQEQIGSGTACSPKRSKSTWRPEQAADRAGHGERALAGMQTAGPGPTASRYPCLPSVG